MKHRIWLFAALILITPVLGACQVSNDPDGWAAPFDLSTNENEQAVVIRDGDNHLVALDLTGPSVLWAFPNSNGEFPGILGEIGTEGFYGLPALVPPDGEELVFGDYDTGVIFAVRRDGSSARVLLDTEDRIVADVLVSPGGETAYAATTDGRVYAVSLESPPLEKNSALWIFYGVDNIVWGSPALVKTETHGSLLLVPSMGGTLYALEVENEGNLAWTFQESAGIASAVVVADGTAFIGAFDKTFYAIDVETGLEIWSQPGTAWFWTTPLVDGETVYAADLDGNVWAWDTRDGTPVWASPYAANDPIRSRPVLTDADTLTVVTRNGQVHAIDKRSSTPIWVSEDIGLRIPDHVLADPLVRNGRLLISNEQGRLFEVEIGVPAFREISAETGSN